MPRSKATSKKIHPEQVRVFRTSGDNKGLDCLFKLVTCQNGLMSEQNYERMREYGSILCEVPCQERNEGR